MHARYAITCQYGNEKMRAEVDLRTDYYADQFGEWRSNTDFDGDQTWDNVQNDVRCRVQNLEHLTVDGNGKVTGSTPAKDQSYIGCSVMGKTAE